MKIVTHLRGVAVTSPWLLHLLLADIVLSLLLPLRPLAPRIVYNVSSRIAESVWGWIQTIFERINGAHIVCSGDALPLGESAIIVVNHVAWADFYMIQALARRAAMLGRCRYFVKRQLRMVPFLGWGLWAIGMPMVSRNWIKDEEELAHVFSGIVNCGFPTWLISFSEATRFSKSKYDESRAWCKKVDKPQPMHLLYPRTKGFIATVQHLRKAPHIKAVYDLSISYQHKNRFQSAPTMWETLSVPQLSPRHGFKFHVHARRFPIESLPDTDDGLACWLEERWLEKGEWLEARRKQWLAQADTVSPSER
ncbi:hypothetical protein XA68_13773 [Ophiocordyceps unilateralis]|uniref:Phospholipid/glycerol acyltransferase domain-containing protein n=1 Tax=Ophiocordyceps unilateralis TaxID=268505 RepID=A0A2A9PV30_OPHUN|nr:hypothetical protein XA68_13773 [Ophiocordyceps unilateralis]